MGNLARILDDDDVLKYYWSGKQAKLGMPRSFCVSLSEQMRAFNSSERKNERVVMMIGRFVRGHVDGDKSQLFGVDFGSELFVKPAMIAVQFFEFQLQSYLDAVNCWSVIAKRKHVVKDIRLLIAKLIWEQRNDAQY
jgi:hypothetical protein